LGPIRWDQEILHTDRGWLWTHDALFPCWLPVTTAGTLPLTGLVLLIRRRSRLRRRARVGCCHQCGYDLRATPLPVAAGGELLSLCPECGTAQE
jgi:hypothetical protein